MDIFHSLFSQVKKIPKNHLLPIGAGCIGLMLFGYGLVNYFHASSPSENISEPQESEKNIPVKIVKKVFIDVEGAILKPGVYQLPFDSRVQDVLIAAGGLSQNADRDFIEKHINLAGKISDGVKIYIPRVGESSAAVLGTTDQTILMDTSGNSSSTNINTASSDALDALPGIGPVTAEKIIGSRPYSSLQDLLTKKVVSKSVFDKIKDKISL